MAKILIVDDSEPLRNHLRSILEQAGHQVIEAVDGQNGLDLLKDNPGVTMILSDLNMPRLDGLAMCKAIREKAEWAQLPIFMLTTESTLDMRVKGKEVGVLAWITKPYVDAHLVAAVSKIMSR